MKLLGVLTTCVVTVIQTVAADPTCYPNGACNPSWYGYNCDCENARNLFMSGMKNEGYNCWKNTDSGNYGVGCTNECAGCDGCALMYNHYWDGSC
jgi:hypothetical protein